MANTEYPVLFVGAGPGDPELITLKGSALEEADLCSTREPVNEALLDYCSPAALGRSSPLSLEEQMALVAAKVRKAGASCAAHRRPELFGAGRAEGLKSLGIEVRSSPE